MQGSELTLDVDDNGYDAEFISNKIIHSLTYQYVCYEIRNFIMKKAILKHYQLMKNVICKDLIAAAMHPKRIEKQIRYYKNIEYYFNTN